MNISNMRRKLIAAMALVAMALVATPQAEAQKRHGKARTTTTARKSTSAKRTAQAANPGVEAAVSELAAIYNKAAANIAGGSLNEATYYMSSLAREVDAVLSKTEYNEAQVTVQQKKKVADAADSVLTAAATLYAVSSGVSPSSPEVQDVLSQIRSNVEAAINPCQTLGELKSALRSLGQ